jgi:uncharacterized protein (AIM24 family)
MGSTLNLAHAMHSLSSFITTHADQDRPGAGPFEVENRATLQVNLQGTVYAKAGAMVAQATGSPGSDGAVRAMRARCRVANARDASRHRCALRLASHSASHVPRRPLPMTQRPRGDKTKFSRKGTLEDGVGKFLKKAVTGEGMTLMKMEGNGRVVLANRGKRVHLLALQPGESLCLMRP